MRSLEERIIKDGKVIGKEILKVDSFLNHQVDPKLLYEMGLEWKRLFSDVSYNKLLTIEASGIGVAVVAGLAMEVPVVFAKKSHAANIPEEVYSTVVHSFTHGNDNDIIVSKKYLNPGDRVIIIDDFLATGEALKGLIEIVNQSGATLVGCGTVIEKDFQHGGDSVRNMGIRLESLARIASMSEEGITFVH